MWHESAKEKDEIMPRRGRRSLLGTMATTAVIAGTATAVSGGMQRHAAGKQEQAAEAQAYEQQQAYDQQQAQINAAVQQATAAQAAAAPAYAPPAAPDPMAQLQQLAQMHAQGLLTDEEFAAAKAKFLA